MASLTKSALIAIFSFYLVGVFGFAGAQLWREWDGDWSLRVHVLDKLEAALAWPSLFIDLN